jgi:hypothetical protein
VLRCDARPSGLVWRSVRAGGDTKTKKSRRALENRRSAAATCCAITRNMRQSRSPSGFASPDPGASARRVLERLSEAECMELPANGGVGRLACTSRNGPTALPVTYKIDGGSIFLGTWDPALFDEDLRTGITQAEYQRSAGPAGAPRQILHRARPAPGWPWPRSAAPVSIQRQPTPLPSPSA